MIGYWFYYFVLSHFIHIVIYIYRLQYQFEKNIKHLTIQVIHPIPIAKTACSLPPKKLARSGRKEQNRIVK